MIIYNYDETTKEYTGTSFASLDPEETKQQGKDVYLIPSYATILKPPTPSEQETVIFENGGWTIIPDYRNLYMVNYEMQPQVVDFIGELPEGYVLATEEQVEKINEDKLYYIVFNGELIINPEYDEIKKRQRELNFNKEFFNTSLGYVRRKFTNKNGEVKDFLSDAFPSLLLAFQQGSIGEIFVYDKPPFTEDVTDWEQYQHRVSITPQFIQECFTQSRTDFFG